MKNFDNTLIVGNAASCHSKKSMGTEEDASGRFSVRGIYEKARQWGAWAVVFAGGFFFVPGIHAAEISSVVESRLNGSDNPIEVVILFNETVAGPAAAAPGSTPAAVLRARAGANRPPLSDLLSHSGPQPSAPSASADLWLANGYLVTLPAETVRQLSSDPRVARIMENRRVELPAVLPASGHSGEDGTNWALDKTGVTEAWHAFGVSGRGVRIGHLDTGIDAEHPDLRGKLAAWGEFNGFGQRVYSQPHDRDIHGTHTAGILVGGSPLGRALGAAPGARLVSAKVLTSAGGTFAQVIAGMQWVLDPDEDPSTDDGVQILSMSLGAPGQHEIFEGIVARLLAAGVLPVMAIGNSGPDRTSSPGNVPGVISVGATSLTDAVANFSSGGTSVWDGVVHVKPEVSAPGVGILSTVPGGDLAAYSGTSMATPFVAATAALLKEYAPGLSVQELKETIQRTAIDLGQAGPDTRYGHGRLDALAALVTASGGSLVRGAVEGELGRAVRVHAKGRDGRVVKTVETNPDTGRFHMVLPAGSYTLEANLGTLRVARREIVAAPREIMELNLYPVAAPDSLDHLLVYPNPFKPEEGHTTVNFAGLPDGADVTIYTFSGAVVRELSASGGLTAWDGRDESGRWMGSGLYFYLATHRSDESGGRLHKKGKLALIR